MSQAHLRVLLMRVASRHGLDTSSVAHDTTLTNLYFTDMQHTIYVPKSARLQPGGYGAYSSSARHTLQWNLNILGGGPGVTEEQSTSGCRARWPPNSCRPISNSERTLLVEMTYVLSRYRKICRMVSICSQWSCQHAATCACEPAKGHVRHRANLWAGDAIKRAAQQTGPGEVQEVGHTL